MSIPIDALRYAGVWDATKTYKYAMFVVSPIDNGAYVWIGSLDITGGADPSVPNPDWVVIPPIATGDITGVTAGTGLSGGGSSGVVTLDNTGIISATAGSGISTSGTNPLTIGNTGVLSLDSQTGSLVTKSGQWYKTSPQSIGGTAGPAVTTTITFDASTSWSDTTSLAYDSITNLWNVNTKGLYHLQAQLSYADMDVPTFGDETHLVNINLGRGAVTNSPIRTAFDWEKPASPTNPDIFVAGIYELQVGDKIQIQVVDHLNNTATYTILGQSGGANAYDYNTFFTWVLIKPLP